MSQHEALKASLCVLGADFISLFYLSDFPAGRPRRVLDTSQLKNLGKVPEHQYLPGHFTGVRAASGKVFRADDEDETLTESRCTNPDRSSRVST